MTEEISFPPQFDVPPRLIEAQKQHLLNEIARDAGPRRLSWPSVPPLRLRFALPAVAVVFAAVAALAAIGTFSGGAKHTAPPISSARGDQVVGALDINYVRSGGALSSIAITLHPNVANARVQLQVVHTDATIAEAATGKAQTQVVFQNDVSTTSPSSSNVSTWSGTLSPSEWSGGCQSGLYQIQYLAIPPGRTFANATEQPGSEFGAGEWFSCEG